jgi:hypothetical protein
MTRHQTHTPIRPRRRKRNPSRQKKWSDKYNKIKPIPKIARNHLAQKKISKDLTENKKDMQDIYPSPKRITQEFFSPNHQELQRITETEDDINVNNTTETSPQEHSRYQELDVGTTSGHMERIIPNPYVRGNDPQAIARRQAA